MNKKVIIIIAVSLAVVALVSVGIWIIAKGGKDSNKNGVADKLEPKGLYAAAGQGNDSYLLYFEGGNVCYGAAVSLTVVNGTQRKIEIRENDWKKYVVSKSNKNLKLETRNNAEKVMNTFEPVDGSFAESFTVTDTTSILEGKAFVKVNNIQQHIKEKYKLSDTDIEGVIADRGFWQDYWNNN
jgi:hypothetical protein